MVSAILMAGYNNKRAVKKYAKNVAEHYGEKFIETGYKPLREFRIVDEGRARTKPVIQFTLEKLFASELVDEIVIVGHKMLLEQRLGKFIREFDKPCRIENQNADISPHVIEHFGIIPKKVKHNTVAGNMIKGYAASRAYDNRKHALFVASDSPLTTKKFIEHFIRTVQDYTQHSAIVFPAVLIDGNRDKLGRRPLRLINDTPYQISNNTDDYGRQGFRLSSLVFVNPSSIDVNTLNTAYNLRKALNPKVQMELFKITHNLGYPNVYSKYFMKKNLSIKECENITSEFFHGKLTVIPMIGENSTYDYDGTDAEYRGITEMLNSA
ncbi:MAG: hypothetical protein SVY10_16800 [Thermodesulfobacteriota bacterium]|nr:hypothetical protein [Thermodesulfobacteriota bacterium]